MASVDSYATTKSDRYGPAMAGARARVAEAQIADSVDTKFRTRVEANDLRAYGSHLSPEDVGLTAEQLVEMFHSQVLSRQLDRIARKLQACGEGFYTVGSSGHECNAAFAEAFRLSDIAFLHYRDAAFQIHRFKSLPGQTPGWDMLLSLVASVEDPISSGRHKVLGSKLLNIPPQTSTIASHLPKAVGAAYSLGLAKTLGFAEAQLPNDGVVICSFGDASANHSTAQGAINTASWASYKEVPMPIVFICEDNGIGISVRTPNGWIAAAFSQRPGIRYLQCNGLDVLETFQVAVEAEQYVRQHRKPVFLHMQCARLQGHAGSDAQTSYRSKEEIASIEDRDPLLHTAGTITKCGILTPEQVLIVYTETEEALVRLAEEAIGRPKLATSRQVMSSLIPKSRQSWPQTAVSAEMRMAALSDDVVLMDKPQPMARLLGWALTDQMLRHENIIIAGQDVGAKGGVYGVTQKLQQRFGSDRVIDTLLDEQSIMGLAIGLAHNGFLPIVEIQFLAYLHNAEDQLRGEAATLSFFSNQQYANPMIIRVPGLGYQKGFGGHFHNDNSLAVLRDIPGVIIACPSNGADAIGMLRECSRLAIAEQRVVVFLEPIALYMARDLHETKDKLWTFMYKAPDDSPTVPIGEVHVEGDGEALAIVTYGNGYFLSRQAQKILQDEYGHGVRVIDMRWLAPLPEEQILAAIAPCSEVLIVDECRRTGSQSEALMALFAERAPDIIASRLAADDTFIPLGNAAMLPLPSRDSIIQQSIECIESQRA